jgi:hypothetical protein
MKIIITFLIVVTLGLTIGCSKSSGDTGNGPQEAPLPENCDGINATFAADVSPIFQTKCATGSGCHGFGSGNGPGPLTDFTSIRDAATAIRAAVNAGRMPKNGSLTSLQLKQINCWIDNGRLNN